VGQMMTWSKRRLFRKDSRGLSPAISTVIMTAAIIVLVLVAMAYGNNYLTSSIAQNEFSTNEQFMVTTGLQIDNVAWMIGRAQTIQYSSTYGDLEILPNALTYTITVNNVLWCTLKTGIILYNVPTTEYSLGKNYVNILSQGNHHLLQSGSAAPDTYVYAIEMLPMSDGNFARIVIVPTIRMMQNTVGSQAYVEFYLPLLGNGTSPGLSQSVTLICQNVDQDVAASVSQVSITASFPLAANGFNSAFFPFKTMTETETFSGSNLPTLELYEGNVSVSVGLYA